MPRVIIWQVTGMTCASCERLIGNVLKDAAGVIDVEVSVKQSKAAVRVRDDAPNPKLDQLNARLREHGYCLSPIGCEVPGQKSAFSSRLWRALGALIVVGLVLLFLSPLRSLVPSVSAAPTAVGVFVLGIIASVSTCLASTGGFMLAYGAEAPSRRKTIFMHVGRLSAFVAGGAILGAIGGALPQGSVAWYGVLALVLGIGFLAVALNLLDLSPSLARLGIALPSSMSRFADRIKQRDGRMTPFLVGAVTFILPCGFTQTAQALALASGSAARGVLIMSAFALGTLPVLLGVTTFATAATLRHRFLRLGIGAVLFFFAIGQVQAGLSVFGFSTDIGALAGAFKASNVEASSQDGAQIINMAVTASGYVPNSFTLKKGVPVRWEIDAQDAVGCTNSIISRDLGISQRLIPGKNTIAFTPTKAGTIAFSCSMGMVRGSFTVI